MRISLIQAPASLLRAKCGTRATATTSGTFEKFAFKTNGAYTATGTVTIRAGEGVEEVLLYVNNAPWTFGEPTNDWNFYELTSALALESGSVYSIQLSHVAPVVADEPIGGFLGKCE